MPLDRGEWTVLFANLRAGPPVSTQMRLSDLQNDQQFCLRIAAGALGEPVCALALDEDVEAALGKRLQRESRTGLDGGPAMLRLTSERRGRKLELGIDCY